MGKINFKEANEMLANGKTYKDIADRFGVTKQYAHSYMNSDKIKPLRKRKNEKFYNEIIYKGFKYLFYKDEKLTVPLLAKRVAGRSDRALQEKLRRLMTGQDSSITIKDINTLLKMSGLTFEKFFERI